MTIKAAALHAENILREPGDAPHCQRVLLCAFTAKAANLIGKFIFWFLKILSFKLFVLWNKIRYADDTINLCVQGATHWDALGHIIDEDRAYNGHDPKNIDVTGLNVLGIEKCNYLACYQ